MMSEIEKRFNHAEYGRRVKLARKVAGLSQGGFGKLLAQELGRPRPFSQAAISDLERGRDRSAVIAPHTLSRIFGTHLEFFTQGIFSQDQLEDLRRREQYVLSITPLQRVEGLLDENSAALLQVGLTPVEIATMRRLMNFFLKPDLDGEIRFRLGHIINNQLDIIEKLGG